MSEPIPPPIPAPAKKGGWIKWVAIGCAGMIVLTAAFFGIIFFVVKKATAEPEAVVHEFLDAAGAEDWEAAYATFSAPLKEAQPFDEFAAQGAANAHLFKVRETTFGNRSVDTSGAEFSGTVTLETGTKMPASFRLVRENDAWKLLAYQVG